VANITLEGVIPSTRAEVKTVTARSLSAANDFAQSNAVFIEEKSVPAGRRFVVTLPKHSVSVITLKNSPAKAQRRKEKP
jgi:alpha-L-arabinofuranosidase